MNDIEILEETMKALKKHNLNFIMINFNEIAQAIENLLKERQADKDRIKELEETLKCTQNSWFEDTKKIEEYKMLDANIAKANEIIKDGIPKSLVKEKMLELEWAEETDKCNCDECRDLRDEGKYIAYKELLGEKQDL